MARLRASAASGERPRRAYVELAAILDADVIDDEYLATRAATLSRRLAGRYGLPAGQVCEAFLRRREFSTIGVWADRLAVPLAVLYKATQHRADIVLVSDWLSRPRKAVLVRRLRLHTAMRAIVNTSTTQMEFEEKHLGVPPAKLHHEPLPVDEHFWVPAAPSREKLVCSVGWEARDYRTLFRAVDGLDVNVRLAVGITALSGARRASASTVTDPLAPFEPLKGTYSYNLHIKWMQDLMKGRSPQNVTVDYQLAPRELRDLYARCRFVVVPLHDVDSDCGMTTITEAMAMGKALIVTRTKGQIDVVRDGQHGIYVPPYDPDALRSAMHFLLANPAVAERMGRAGRALVERQHSLDTHVQRLAALLTAGERQADASNGPGDLPSSRPT